MKAYFVNKRLAFGSGIKTWRHVEQLQALGITHVINLRFNRHGKKEETFKAIWLPFRDDKEARPRWFHGKAWTFFSKAMEKPNSKVFVMCRVGICRSASLTHFLLRASGTVTECAQQLVVGARPAASVCKAYKESSESWLLNRGETEVRSLRHINRSKLIK